MATSRAAALLLVTLVASALAQGTAAASHASRTTRTRTWTPPAVRVRCTEVHGVVAGETCGSVARSAGIPDAQFLALNPNITCAAVFLGQWVCVAGAVVG